MCGQGLDGEATEPMVNELKEQERAEAGSEEEYAVARAVLEGNFLSQLLDRLQTCEAEGFQERAEWTLLLRLLHQAVHLEVTLHSESWEQCSHHGAINVTRARYTLEALS